MYIFQLILLTAFTVTLWLPSPDRDAWAPLLLPAVGIAAVQSYRLRRIYGASRLQPLLITVLALCMISIYTAPFPTRGWVLLLRPAAGFWIFSLWVETLRTPGKSRFAAFATAALAALILIIGLSALQWTGKASRFSEITDLLPRWQDFAWWRGGLNVNEYAGALTWVLPTLAGLALRPIGGAIVRLTAIISTIVLSAILLLGLSLSGLMGVVSGIALLIAPRRYFRPALLAAAVVLLAGNLAVLLAPAPTADLLAEFSGRPGRRSLEHRAVMWQRAQAMIADHPFSGVGIAMYRQLRDDYPTPGFEHVLLPHPHNEALQWGTDLGLPGLLIYAAIIVGVGFCAWNTHLYGSAVERALSVALLAGLFGHAVYALTDAIPIWDRFAFMHWWWLGLLAGLDARVSARRSALVRDTMPSA